MADDAYKLKLPDDVREQLELLLCHRVDEAVSAAAGRNSDLRIWRDQLEGNGVVAQNQLWANACNLNDPLSMKAFLTILSQLLGALQRDPMVAVEAFREEDVEGARILEGWLSMASAQNDILARVYDLSHNACRDTAVVGYCGWSQRTRKKRVIASKDSSGHVMLDGEDDESGTGEPVALAEEVVEERYDIRAVALDDFFLWPANSVSVDRATMVAERMYVTEEELYDGIDDYGYDEAMVEQLCAMGPVTLPDDDRRSRMETDGIAETDSRGGGFYEIFTCYTRLPRRVNGGSDTMVPKHMLQDDFLVVCCPAQQIVLKMAHSPFDERPYFVGGILPKPNTILGYGMMKMLEPLQAEANSNLQYTFDTANINMAAPVILPESERDQVAKVNIGPGSLVFLKDVEGARPWPQSGAPLRDGLAMQEWMEGQYQSLVSAEGQGELQSKVRKNGEVMAATNAASAKFGMYLSGFQRTVVAPLFQRLVALKTQFGDVDDDGEAFMDPSGKMQKLTSRALRGKYNIVATGTSLTHSPEARVEVAQQKQAVQVQYLQAKAQLPPEMAPLLWHGAREILYDMGERNPEAWLGEEPTPPPPPLPEQPTAPQAPVGLNGTSLPPQMPLGANN